MTWRWDELPLGAAEIIRAWPPVSLASSPALAETLGLSASCLRNWRNRHQGPEHEPRYVYGAANPTTTYYLVSKIWAWLDDTDTATHWLYSRDWIRKRVWWNVDTALGCIKCDHELNEEQVEHVAEWVRRHHRYFELARWPCPQPRRRPRLLTRPSVSEKSLLDAESAK